MATAQPVRYRDPDTGQMRDAHIRERRLHAEGWYVHLTVRGDMPGVDLEPAVPERLVRYLPGIDYTNVPVR